MRRPALIRKILVYVVYTLLVCCFQVSFPEIMSYRGQVADLMLVFTVVVSYFFGFLDGAVVGICVGILRDYFAAPAIAMSGSQPVAAIGLGLLVMFLASVFGSSFFTKRMRRNTLFAFVAVTAATLIYKISGHILIKIWTSAVLHGTYNMTILRILTDSILPQVLLNLIAAIPLVLLLRLAGPYSKGVNPGINAEGSVEDNLWLKI
ncbi:hypothetical protein SAMN06296952_0374 [Oscillospiraceae bacterium]|nr:hypothetical protein SAMN06296952_0374 [Oscillospiraceae bacterium]